MEISLLAAKLLGIYLVLSGWFLISRGRTIPNLLKDFFDHPAIVYLTGTVLIFLSSLLLIKQGNVWDGSWRVVVTIFAWLILLKGIGYIFFPDELHKMVTKRMVGILNVYGVVMVIVGLCLFYIK